MYPQDILPLHKALEFDEIRHISDTLIHVLGQIAGKNGCLKTVIEHLNTWENKSLVKKAIDEIVDVYKRYKKFLFLSQDEAIAYIETYYKKQMANHNELGKKGEELATDFLLKNGYEIIIRNYTYQKAEVDIIAKKENVLAIIEVKTRTSSNFGDPQEFLKPKQIQRIIKAVDFFVNDNEINTEVRFDIIAIVLNKKGMSLEHLEDAFYHF
jgi:putative endonuclease